MKNLLILLMLVSATGCGQTSSKKAREQSATVQPVQAQATRDGYKKAYFSSGCFWCSESIFESVLGVVRVTNGYSGGTGAHPTYETYAQMGYAETVEVLYNPVLIGFRDLLTVYFGSQNVTQQNGQGPDRGSGYRSIVFYQNAQQKKEIEAKIAAVQKNYKRPVAAEILPFQKFWKAEAYHQNFEERHPNNAYIRHVSEPRLKRFEAQYPQLLKKNADSTKH